MKINYHFIQLTITLILIFPTVVHALEIREELYAYREDTARIPAGRTFIMSNQTITAEPQIPTSHTLLVHFDLCSADLSSTESGLLLSRIKIQGLDRHTPLTITGHSCALGSKHLNLMLSLQRAVTIANFLSDRGYTISSLHAEGEENPLTTNPMKFHLNRRVEISIQH